jgi:hypothetical protein
VHSLTNRLRLSWLTVVGFTAFLIVWALRPAEVSVARLFFATDVVAFAKGLQEPLQFSTVAMLRAQLAAEMMFLVAYGMLLRASLGLLTSVPLGRLAWHGTLVLMAADAAENVLGLMVLRTVGEPNVQASPWWFVAMNGVAATKWVVAGGVLLLLASGWRCEAGDLRGWRRRVALLIAVSFAVGGLASASLVVGAWFLPLDWFARGALVAPAAGFLLQFRLLDTSGLIVRFLYLARVPLAFLLCLAAFGPIALGPAVSLLGGILVAANVTGVAVTTAAAVALQAACGTQINNVRAYGWERARDESLRVLDHDVIGSCVFWTGVVASATLLFSVGLVSLSLSVARIIGGVAAGAAGALLLLLIIEWVTAWLSDSTEDFRRSESAVPFWKIQRLREALETVAETSRPPAVKRFLVGTFVARLFGNKSGYVETLPDGRRRILPGHTLATVQLILTAVAFGTVLYFKEGPAGPVFDSQLARATEASFLVPTVTSILLLWLLIGWILSGTAFFFDRYRIPLVAIALMAAVTAGTWKWTDYAVDTMPPGESYHLATPGEVLRAFGAQPLVVAAAGGGIQAGAWTARVLAELDGRLKGTLRTRLAMISAVSGGSMGALYYGAYEGQSLRVGADQALKSSLDQIATIALRNDTWRLFGASPGLDRGGALERSWEQRLPVSQQKLATLREWSKRTHEFVHGVDARPFPAFLFNSTIVEYGQPMAFATTRFPTNDYRTRVKTEMRPFPAVESANRVLRLSMDDDGMARDIGLKAVTAARLSAAFPYVSPAATLNISGVEPLHLVDGAYYDNYGLIALTQWLDDALEELCKKKTLPKTVDVVVATGLVAADTAVSARLKGPPDAKSPIDEKIERHGWFWQLLAPPVTALNARSFAQRAGSLQTLQLLVDKWEGRVTIVPHVLSYPGTNTEPVCQAAPLSWKLTAPQRKCIDRAWETVEPTLAAVGAL